MQSTTQLSEEQRRAELVRLINGGPGQMFVPESDKVLLADLIVHALDQTTEHMLDHIKRAAPMFSDPIGAHSMASLLFRLMEAQCEQFSLDLIGQALQGVLRTGGEEALRSAEEELERFKRRTAN
jgi:hypothetical protein